MASIENIKNILENVQFECNLGSKVEPKWKKLEKSQMYFELINE